MAVLLKIVQKFTIENVNWNEKNNISNAGFIVLLCLFAQNSGII